MACNKVFMPSSTMKNIESLPSKPLHSSSIHIHLPKTYETITTTTSCKSPPHKAITQQKPPLKPTTMLAHFWKQIQGQNNWENLINPLHFLLKQEIIRYGEFVSACYKAFDMDSTSNRYLNSRYSKQNMFKSTGMENSGYQVTKYIYATPDVNINGTTSRGRWIGYVAVSSHQSVSKLGRRDIVISFRGTVTVHEWIANLMSSLTPARLDPHQDRPDVRVESGFLSLYTSKEGDNKFGLDSCREQLLSEVSRLIMKYKDEDISISLAGHSMGSSLAILLGYDIAELGLNRMDSRREKKSIPIPITVFSYGGPRVGNLGFKKRCEELGLRVLRVVNVKDPVTKLPGVLLNENFRVLSGRYKMLPWAFWACYEHIGVEVELDFFNMQNPSCVHDMESYIELLRCPNNGGVDENSDGDLLSKAKEMLSFDVVGWRNGVGNLMMNLVESQRTNKLIVD